MGAFQNFGSGDQASYHRRFKQVIGIAGRKLKHLFGFTYTSSAISQTPQLPLLGNLLLVERRLRCYEADPRIDRTTISGQLLSNLVLDSPVNVGCES
ncbi:MAG: hypothetical protein QOF56_883 [Acidobacteriaceae bacterium]|jgi:hypothetical protein|nr:hypothetical protein [Acidobacteriaceae bacterium]